jgi:hypothetical protein
MCDNGFFGSTWEFGKISGIETRTRIFSTKPIFCCNYNLELWLRHYFSWSDLENSRLMHMHIYNCITLCQQYLIVFSCTVYKYNTLRKPSPLKFVIFAMRFLHILSIISSLNPCHLFVTSACHLPVFLNW